MVSALGVDPVSNNLVDMIQNLVWIQIIVLGQLGIKLHQIILKLLPELI